MRSAVLALVAACSFEPGAFQSSRDAGAGSVADAARDGSVVVQPGDAATTVQPDANTCTTDGLPCVGTVVAKVCNGGCWVSCTSSLGVPNQLSTVLACATWGGKLAPIRSAADQSCVETALFPGQASWIGLEQAPFSSGVAAGWSNNGDGMPLNATFWGMGQPNDQNGTEGGQENCAFMNTAGEWHDTPCGDSGLVRFSCRR